MNVSEDDNFYNVTVTKEELLKAFSNPNNFNDFYNEIIDKVLKQTLSEGDNNE